MELASILLCIYATYKESGDNMFLCGDEACLCVANDYYCEIPNTATEESCNETVGNYFGRGLLREANSEDLKVLVSSLFAPRSFSTTTATTTTTTTTTTAQPPSKQPVSLVDHRQQRKRNELEARRVHPERLGEGGEGGWKECGSDF